MIVEFDKSFIKSLGKIKDVSVNKRITHIIGEFDQASEIGDIRNVKKLVGFRNYYIIRIGDYRLGIELKNRTTVRFIVVAHRKDIYRIFP